MYRGAAVTRLSCKSGLSRTMVAERFKRSSSQWNFCSIFRLPPARLRIVLPHGQREIDQPRDSPTANQGRQTMKRRAFMLSVGGAAAGMVLLPRMAFAAPGVIDWYTSSDQNILDFWTNVVKPKFEAANPGVTLNLVDAGDGPGNIAIGERALAALSSNADPQADYFESYDPLLPAGAIDAGLFVNMKEAGLSNWSKINPLGIESDYSMPYRGSQVLLAYDTTKLDPANVPKTWPDLIAWIKANPGQFIYNRPNKGGSGGNFVRRAIYEANGKDPSKFTTTNYAELGEAALTP